MNYIDERPHYGLTVRYFTSPNRLNYVSTYVTNDVSFGSPGIISTTIRYLDEYGRCGKITYDGVIHIGQAERIVRSRVNTKPLSITIKGLITKLFKPRK